MQGGFTPQGGQGGEQQPFGGAPIPPPSGQPSGFGTGPGMGGPGYGGPPQGTVNSTMLLVMGILGIICCGILAPITWIQSNAALATINAGGAPESERQMVTIARVLGIVGTVLIVLGILFYGFLFAVGGFSRGAVRGTTFTTPRSTFR